MTVDELLRVNCRILKLSPDIQWKNISFATAAQHKKFNAVHMIFCHLNISPLLPLFMWARLYITNVNKRRVLTLKHNTTKRHRYPFDNFWANEHLNRYHCCVPSYAGIIVTTVSTDCLSALSSRRYRPYRLTRYAAIWTCVSVQEFSRLSLT